MKGVSMNDIQVIAETRHLRFVQRGSWAFVQRTNVSDVVCIVAVTDEDKLLLVEQYRPPVDCRVVEFPAGLAGDLPGEQDEPLEKAARRELIEETGYQAQTFDRIFSGASSAGLTDEMMTFFLASGLKKINEGGGDETEQITVHEVPIDEVNQWLEKMMQEGCQVDARVYAGLYFLRREKN